MWSYLAAPYRIVDGDTYEMVIDLGFRISIREHVRLLGIDCPEKNTPKGKVAKAFVEDWFRRYPKVCITTQRAAGAEVKTFDRWVASVVGLDLEGSIVPGADLAATLRAEGLFKPVEHLGKR